MTLTRAASRPRVPAGSAEVGAVVRREAAVTALDGGCDGHEPPVPAACGGPIEAGWAAESGVKAMATPERLELPMHGTVPAPSRSLARPVLVALVAGRLHRGALAPGRHRRRIVDVLRTDRCRRVRFGDGGVHRTARGRVPRALQVSAAIATTGILTAMVMFRPVFPARSTARPQWSAGPSPVVAHRRGAHDRFGGDTECPTTHR
jgi:hypothetical protein